MNQRLWKTTLLRHRLIFLVAILLTGCGTATFTKTGSDAQIESLRSFHLAFIDEFAVPDNAFDTEAFDAKLNEGNEMFQQAIADEKFTIRRPVLIDLKEQFDADAAYLRSKASGGKVTRALASQMKKDTDKTYDHALGR